MGGVGWWGGGVKWGLGWGAVGWGGVNRGSRRRGTGVSEVEEGVEVADAPPPPPAATLRAWPAAEAPYHHRHDGTSGKQQLQQAASL